MRFPAALSLALLCAPALADHTNTARVTLSPNFSGGNGPVDLIVTQPGTAQASASTTGGANSAGDATARCDYGRMSLAGHSVGSLGASASGATRDTVTIFAPGVPAGTQGTLTYTIHVEFSLSSSSGSSAARWSVSADIGGGATDISKSGELRSPSLGGNYVGDPSGDYSATIPFTFNQPMPLNLGASGTALTGYDFQGPGAASFNNPRALTWQGVNVIMINNVPVHNAFIVSESGTNWMLPAGCPADFNNDGFLDFFDIDGFIAAFESGDPSADFNNDGFLDFFDADAFIASFESGC